jgi:hypothetical protein
MAERTKKARLWDRSRGMETLIAEALAKIKPRDPLRLASKQRAGND